MPTASWALASPLLALAGTHATLAEARTLLASGPAESCNFAQFLDALEASGAARQGDQFAWLYALLVR
eukprot:6217991-Prymnesium_polylepis.1